MAMFGTTQGSPKPTKTRTERVGTMPKGAAAPKGERTRPTATRTGTPNSSKIK